MKAIGPSIALLIVLCAAAWAILVAALWVMAGTDAYRHVPVLISVGPFVPFIFGRFASRHFAKRVGREVTPKERIWLGIVGTLGVAVVAYVAEAGITHQMLSDTTPGSFLSFLMQPPFSRYTVSGIYDLTFATLAMLTAGFVCFVSIPAQVTLMVRRKPD